ncbi:DUF3037 domain-containing protein [Nocardioides sp.]|jgi:hypothetical protein|uniref:DUF3037 domain-containing protein n=1 Tax=Nocardioides sp. TaxID=35761 RepID=UPI00262ED77A|nr:DUF3037 domain-containing protein [Nocardioides sp.]
MSGTGDTEQHAYQYVALRCVPRADREEFVNVGVVLYCHATDYLQCAWRVDPARLGALDALVDPDQLRAALTFVDAVCDGAVAAGRAGEATMSQRFGFLKAPRSTVLQPGPVHGGLSADPARQLEHLLHHLVG